MSDDAILMIDHTPLRVRLHPDAVVRDEWGGSLYEITAPFLPMPVRFGRDRITFRDVEGAVSLVELVRACLASPDRTLDADAVLETVRGRPPLGTPNPPA